jgi:hypothetical protein
MGGFAREIPTGMTLFHRKADTCRIKLLSADNCPGIQRASGKEIGFIEGALITSWTVSAEIRGIRRVTETGRQAAPWPSVATRRRPKPIFTGYVLNLVGRPWGQADHAIDKKSKPYLE